MKMTDKNYVVIIQRKDEPGDIRWTDSPLTLDQAIRAAEEFLRTQTGQFQYSERDVTIQNDISKSVRLSLGEAKALSQRAYPYELQ